MPQTLLTHKQHCVLCTQDPELEEQLTGYLQDLYIFWPCTSPFSALSQLERRSNCLVVVDLRFDGATSLLMSLSRRKENVVVAFGSVDTVPYREAVDLGLYAVADIDGSYASLQALLEQAAKHLASLEEIDAVGRRLADRAINPMLVAPGLAMALPAVSDKIELISEVIERLQSPTGVLEMALAEISRQYLPSSVGIFALNGESYALRSGMRCPEESWSYRFGIKDSFVLWMKIHGQLISRKALAEMEQSEARLMLGQVLDTLSADILIPLTQGSHLLGWLYLGRQINGRSYSQEQFPDLLSIGDRISGFLRFLSESEIRKSLYQISQGIMASLPSGLLLINDKGRVIWSNERARTLLGLSETDLMQEVDFIDTILADVVHRAVGNSGKVVGGERQGGGGAQISISGRCLETDSRTVLVVVEDMAEQFNALRQTERITEIVYQVRASVTAIKSFSQLLPEKHDDPRFINEFGTTVEREIGALINLSKQLGSPRESGCLPS